jgi:hypothetical protein
MEQPVRNKKNDANFPKFLSEQNHVKGTTCREQNRATRTKLCEENNVYMTIEQKNTRKTPKEQNRAKRTTCQEQAEQKKTNTIGAKAGST